MGLQVPKYGYSNIDINEYLEKRSEELLHYITDARQGDNLVGFIGGPPCPDFSVAGNNVVGMVIMVNCHYHMYS